MMRWSARQRWCLAGGCFEGGLGEILELGRRDGGLLFRGLCACALRERRSG